MSKAIISVLLVLSAALTAQGQSVEYAEITFLEKEYHFGVITEGEQVQNVFEFTNTGAVPLVISNARGNCGCTVPEYSMEPIMPGDTSRILVRFDSKRKVGRQKKSLMITANTDPEITIISLVGMVLKSPALKSSYEDPRIKEVDIDKLDIYTSSEASYLNVDLTNYSEDLAKIEIYNMQDQLKISETKVSLEEIKKIDISELYKGTYVVSISVKGKHRITKQFQKL